MQHKAYAVGKHLLVPSFNGLAVLRENQQALS